MKILQVYNRYRSGGGGETVVVHNTMAILQGHGHEVRLLERDSAEVAGLYEKITSAVNGVYSLSARRDLLREIKAWNPDIVHVHNLYPLFSPSVLDACRQSAVPVVMTVHNYGLTCPVQTHVRAGRECRECATGDTRSCIRNNCRENVLESVAYAVRHSVANRMKLFSRNITLFLPVSEYVKGTLEEGGIPAEQMAVLPNGVALPDRLAEAEKGTYILFLGRLTHEKGIEALMEAARNVPGMPVRIYGDGPLANYIRENRQPHVSILPWAKRGDLADIYRNARCVVVPSLWHDPCPMVAIEALSYGLPVIASRVGGLATMIVEGETGFLVDAGDSAMLSSRMRRISEDAELARRMGLKARSAAEMDYSHDAYYAGLTAAYRKAMGHYERASAVTERHPQTECR